MKIGGCDRESVVLLASGSLGADESSKLRWHLRQCASCRGYHEEMLALCDTHTKAACRLAEAEVSPGVYARAAAAFRDWPRNNRNEWPPIIHAPWLRAAAVAAALLMLAGGAVLFRRPRPSGPAATQPPARLAPKTELEAANPNLITYRLALNRSPEELDQLLAREASRSGLGPTTSFRMGVTRPNSDL